MNGSPECIARPAIPSTAKLVDGAMASLFVAPAFQIALPVHLTVDKVAMEKFAIGAGAGLALVADHIVAGENTRMSFPFLQLGLVPDWGSTQSLIRKAGWGTAKRLVLDCASLKGSALLDLGVVEQVVADDSVMDVATDKALEFSRLPRLALRQFKEAMRCSTQSIDVALAAEEDDQTACFLSEEFEEGLSALQQKRAPDFFRDSSDE